MHVLCVSLGMTPLDNIESISTCNMGCGRGGSCFQPCLARPPAWVRPPPSAWTARKNRLMRSAASSMNMLRDCGVPFYVARLRLGTASGRLVPTVHVQHMAEELQTVSCGQSENVRHHGQSRVCQLRRRAALGPLDVGAWLLLLPVASHVSLVCTCRLFARVACKIFVAVRRQGNISHPPDRFGKSFCLEGSWRWMSSPDQTLT